MTKVKCTCQLCGKEYFLFPSLAKKNKFCGKLCHNRSNAWKNAKKFKGETHWNTGKRFRLKEWPKIKCRFCLKTFECEPNQYRNGKKFCSKVCFDKFQTYRGENSSKIWKRESIKLYGSACEKCGAKDEKIDCHHINRDRSHNPEDGSNWIRLCDRCHKLIHFVMNQRAPVISRAEFLDSSFQKDSSSSS